MANALPLLIGFRYTRAKQRNSFISFVSLFAFLGMALGVFALIVVLSVMNGFDAELRERILRAVPHGHITQEEGLQDWPYWAQKVRAYPFVKGAAPFIAGQALLSANGLVRPAELQAIDIAAEPAVSKIHEHILAGSIAPMAPGEFGMVLGSIAARNMELAVGDKVLVTLPQISITPAGAFPRTKRFTLVGIFEVGAQVDQSLALINLEDGQKLFKKGSAVDGLRLEFDSIYAAPGYLNELTQALDGDLTSSAAHKFIARDWSQTQGSLFQAVKMEKTVVSVMLAIIIFVAAFNIVTSLIMMVGEKRSDIAVLRTMGMSVHGIVAIFMVQGIAIGVLGIAIGSLCGIGAALTISQIIEGVEALLGVQIFDPDVYFVSYFPSLWQWQDTLKVVTGATITCVLASVYPAWRASKIAPAEALRYNL
jgi:lipoprotein-releasing system permease protein